VKTEDFHNLFLRVLQKAEVKKQLDQLYEGNKDLILGHFYLDVNAIGMDTKANVMDYYKKAFKLIPESTYLKKYMNENK